MNWLVMHSSTPAFSKQNTGFPNKSDWGITWANPSGYFDRSTVIWASFIHSITSSLERWGTIKRFSDNNLSSLNFLVPTWTNNTEL